MTVRFARPCSKSHYRTIYSPEGEKKIQKWSSQDVGVVRSGYWKDISSSSFI